MTLYTVYDRNDWTNIVARGVTAAVAAEIILTDDGRAYDIRRVDDEWQLYVSQGSRNTMGGLVRFVRALDRGRPIVSVKQSLAEATEEIGCAVVFAARDRGPEATTDEAYDRLIGEAES